MAEESFPFQELAEGDRTVSAAMFAKHFGLIRSRGVARDVDGALAVGPSSPAAMSVDVAPGAAFVGLTELRAYRNTLARTLALAAADPTNPRHDLVVLDLDTATTPTDTRRVAALVVTGTPAGSPADPALTQTETHYQLPLARVVVPAAAATIGAGDLTDLRAYSSPQNLGLVPSGIGAVLDGGGVALPDAMTAHVEIPFAGVITAFRLFADQSGSITVKVLKDTYANYPPTHPADDISNGGLSIAAADKAQDTALSGWTTTLAAGDILAFRVVGAATAITRVTAQLTVDRL